MKLTETQKNKIGNYLLDRDLNIKEFFEEIYDHFIEDVEHQMHIGIDFENAFSETSNKFVNHRTIPWYFKMFEELKALECEYIKKQISNEFRYIFRFLFTMKALLISCLIIGLLLVFEQYPSFKILSIIISVLLIIYIALLFNKKIFSLEKFFPETKTSIDFKLRVKNLNSIFAYKSQIIFFTCIHFILTFLLASKSEDWLYVDIIAPAFLFIYILSIISQIISLINLDKNNSIRNTDEAY